MTQENKFTSQYYNGEYFADPVGKAFHKSNGTIQHWGYRNPTGDFAGALSIARAWYILFRPKNMLDVGAGRGTFIAYARKIGIEAEGFDFSEWAVKHRFWKCKRKWLRVHDATEPWPYRDNSFDLVTALDFYEHIYSDDLQFVIDEMYRVAKKWIFLQIAVAGSGGRQGQKEEGYILKKGEVIPMPLEGCAVAGHVTVQHESFWYQKFEHSDWRPRRDLVKRFCSLVNPEVIKNWLLNSIIIMSHV